MAELDRIFQGRSNQVLNGTNYKPILNNNIYNRNVYAANPKVDIGNAKIKTLDKDTFNYSIDDGKISTKDKLKNFAKGLISPITAMFSSPKNFLIGAGMVAAGAALTVATGGAIAPVFVALGVTGGAIQLGKSIYNAHNATTDDEAVQAWQGIGSGTSAVGMSVIGSKAALKGAGVNTKGMGFLRATVECFKQVPNSVSKSVNAFTSGEAVANLKNVFKPKKSANTKKKTEQKNEAQQDTKKKVTTEDKTKQKPKAETKPKQEPTAEQKPTEQPKKTDTAETKPVEQPKKTDTAQAKSAEAQQAKTSTENPAETKPVEPKQAEKKPQSSIEEIEQQFKKAREFSKARDKFIKESHNMSADEVRAAIDKMDDTYGLDADNKKFLEGIYDSKVQELQEVQNAYNNLLQKAEKMSPVELERAINDRQSGLSGTKFSAEQEAALRKIHAQKVALIQTQQRNATQADYTRKMNTAKDVVRKHMKDLDGVLLDENGRIKYFDFDTDSHSAVSFEELITPYDEDLGTIYHGTTPEAKASILKQGFSEEIAPMHGYKDGPGGTYFTRTKTSLYGDSVVEARFKGKVGQANTDNITSIKTLLSNRTKVEKFVRNLGQYDEASISGEAILQQYIRQKIGDMGYQGIMGTNYSATANCRYFAALDPSLIEIIS